MLKSFYPLAERPTSEEKKRFQQPETHKIKIMAISADEMRPPRKNERYLSGGVVQAWRAPNDLSTPYHIASLVLVRTRMVQQVVETPSGD